MNNILLLVEKIDDMRPIARAWKGVKDSATTFDLNKPEHKFYPETNRFWIYVCATMVGYKSKYDTLITLAVTADSYDQVYHGWLELMEHLKEE